MASKEIKPAVVAKLFIKQFYEVFTKNSSELYRFYQEESSFSYGAGTNNADLVTGLEGIRTKITALALQQSRIDFSAGTLDAQPSVGDSLFITVTGHFTPGPGMADVEAKATPFVHTFLLAAQYAPSASPTTGSTSAAKVPVAYYVRNSAFRLLAADLLTPAASAAATATTSNGTILAAGSSVVQVTPTAAAAPGTPDTFLAAKAASDATAAAAAEVETAGAPLAPQRVDLPVSEESVAEETRREAAVDAEQGQGQGQGQGQLETAASTGDADGAVAAEEKAAEAVAAAPGPRKTFAAAAAAGAVITPTPTPAAAAAVPTRAPKRENNQNGTSPTPTAAAGGKGRTSSNSAGRSSSSAAASAPAATTTSLFVSHLPAGATADSLREVFAAYGEVQRVDLKRGEERDREKAAGGAQAKGGSKSFAFVHYVERSGAEAAMSAGVVKCDGSALKVEYQMSTLRHSGAGNVRSAAVGWEVSGEAGAGAGAGSGSGSGSGGRNGSDSGSGHRSRGANGGRSGGGGSNERGGRNSSKN